jgi:hypothetical protein
MFGYWLINRLPHFAQKHFSALLSAPHLVQNMVSSPVSDVAESERFCQCLGSD